MKNWLVIGCLALLFGVNAQAADFVSSLKFYEVKAGDTLTNRFGARAAASVCELNLDLERIKSGNCNRLVSGEILQLPENVGLHEELTISGEFRWTKVGGAPLKGCGKRDENLINEEAWAKLGYTEEEKSELRAKLKLGSADQMFTQLKPGMRFPAVAFCEKGKVAFRKNVIAAWKDDQAAVWAKTFVLQSGKRVHWVMNCGNWVPDVSVPPVVVSPPVQSIPEQPVSPPPVTEEPPVVTPPVAEQEPPEEVEPLCLLDPKLFLGQEKEPKRAGNDVKSSNLSAALFCTWRGQGGTHGLGFGFMGTWFEGHVNGGAGYFSGRMLAFGPGYEYIADDNWNIEAKLLFGRIHENFAQSQFQEDRTINFVGPAVSLNLGQRRARGEKWFPETRLFGQYGVATSVKANVSNFGQPGDTSEYSQFGSLLQLGVHQDIYDAQWLTVWARVGYFRESPFSESLNLRVGLSDPYRICGVGVGLDFDLQNGGQAFGYGWWCDGVKGVRVVRAEYRLSQIIEETGATFDNKDGTLFVPMPSATPAATVKD